MNQKFSIITNRREWILFLKIYIFRALNAIFINTYFDPDEYWQAQEVAHHFVFGEGYLTWEWSFGLRGFLYPCILSVAYFLVKLTGLEHTDMIWIAPRLLQAFFAALTDYFTYKFAKKHYGNRSGNWALFCSLTSFFNAYAGVRTFSNCIETTLTIMVLYFWPFHSLSQTVKHDGARESKNTKRTSVNDTDDDETLTQLNNNHSLFLALLIAGISCILRPTSIIIWIFLGSWLLHQNKPYLLKITGYILVVGTLVISINFLVDYIYYGEWLFVPYNFFKFNLIEGIASFYGTHSWHWYISQGIPVTTMAHLPFAIYGGYLLYTNKINLYNNKKPNNSGEESPCKKQQQQSFRQNQKMNKCLIWCCLWVIFCYSLQSHKEFRFIMPLLPLAHIFSAVTLTKLSQKKPICHTKLQISVIVILLVNSLVFLFLATSHQRGVIEVLRWFRYQNQLEVDFQMTPLKSILFLMPCHSTPYRAFLHEPNVRMDFITCHPPIRVPMNQRQQYSDETDLLYKDPLGFIQTQLPPINQTKPATEFPVGFQEHDKLLLQNNHRRPFAWPSHLVFFEALEPVIVASDIPIRYVECARFFNSFWHDDDKRKGDVIVYCEN